MKALMDYLDGTSSRTPAPDAIARRSTRGRRYVRTAVFVAAAAVAIFGLLVATANAQTGRSPAG